MLKDVAIKGEKVSKIAYKGKIIYSSYKMPKIVTFHDGTDEEIAKMLEAHYKGLINISDYWHVGDIRVIHIDEALSGIARHVAQNMTMVIYDFDHDDLTTPINGKTKAAVTVGFREAMGNAGDYEYEYYWGSQHYPVGDAVNYSESVLKARLNGTLLAALPSINSLIKEVNKKNLKYHSKSDGAPLITKDKIWLLSYPEVFGAKVYDRYLNGTNPSDYEGTQYEYMKISSNRIKKVNDNGTASSNASSYWLRSPSSYSGTGRGYSWIEVSSGGTVSSDDGVFTAGLAPAFCL